MKNSKFGSILRVNTPIGVLTAMVTPDKEYPGITVDLEDHATGVQIPIQHAEYNPETKTIVSRVWGDAEQEDYTDRVDHTGIKKVFDTLEKPIHENSPIAYICSPYGAETALGVHNNVENAKKYGKFAISKGYVPFIAHIAICGFLNDASPEERNIGLCIDNRFIDKCDELWVFGDDISNGMKMELAYATLHHIPVRHFTTDCVEVEYDIT